MRDRAVLFGDGAARWSSRRTTSGDGRGFLGFAMYTDGEHWDKLYVPGGGCKSRPYFTPEMFENLGTIPIVEGRQVFRLAAQLMPAAVQEVLAGNGRTLADLDLLLMHQANLRINEAAQKVLGLPDEKVFNNIEKYGNTTAANAPDRLPRGEARGQGEARRPRRLHRARRGPSLGRGAGGRLGARAHATGEASLPLPHLRRDPLHQARDLDGRAAMRARADEVHAVVRLDRERHVSLALPARF